jgi:hypothetical protein
VNTETFIREQRTLTVFTVHRTKWFAGNEKKQGKIILFDACGKQCVHNQNLRNWTTKENLTDRFLCRIINCFVWFHYRCFRSN